MQRSLLYVKPLPVRATLDMLLEWGSTSLSSDGLVLKGGLCGCYGVVVAVTGGLRPALFFLLFCFWRNSPLPDSYGTYTHELVTVVYNEELLTYCHSGSTWSTPMNSKKLANPSLSHIWSHHLSDTRFPNHCKHVYKWTLINQNYHDYDNTKEEF